MFENLLELIEKHNHLGTNTTHLNNFKEIQILTVQISDIRENKILND